MNTKSFVYILVTVVFVALNNNSLAQKTEPVNIAREKAIKASVSKEPRPSDEALNQLTNRIVLLQPTLKKIKDKEVLKTLNTKIWSICPNYPKDQLMQMSKEEISMWLTHHFSEGLSYQNYLFEIKEGLSSDSSLLN